MKAQIKYELSHDILAARLLQKSKSEEAYHRLRIKELLADRLNWHQEQIQNEQKPYLLTKEDLSLIEPYIKSIRLSKEETAYLKESQKSLSNAIEAEKKALQKSLELQKTLTIQQKKVIKQQEKSRRNIIIYFVSFFLISAIFVGVIYYQDKNIKNAQTRSSLKQVELYSNQDHHQDAILILETIKPGADDKKLIDSLLERSNTLKSLNLEFDSLMKKRSINDISNFLEAETIIEKAKQLNHKPINNWRKELEENKEFW